MSTKILGKRYDNINIPDNFFHSPIKMLHIFIQIEGFFSGFGLFLAKTNIFS